MVDVTASVTAAELKDSELVIFSGTCHVELESSGLCCLHDCLVGSIGLGGLDLLDVVSSAEETHESLLRDHGQQLLARR